ncbi:uncharacterized protein At1g65710-like [Cucurbita maxima]|uniref:Uncharacterized protein At1g65710-like n=1 Tax=Cucurbita maxima TaxID=3661 RepID=A0A6J1JR37_CUCMA|nr:uncharacterized protein At1g65710-like [Cucurbita maxima]
MGACLSKKKKTLPSFSSTHVPQDPPTSCNAFKPIIPISHPPAAIDVNREKTEQENGVETEYAVRKEVFVINHRKSHDGRDKNGASVLPNVEEIGGVLSSSSCEILESGDVGENLKVGLVRTSSCTREEVDAILIQCGRLSRSSSANGNGRKYSGSKRSFDFDHSDRDGVNSGNYGDEDEDGKNPISVEVDDDGTPAEKRHNQRQRHRQSSRYSPSLGRRRTPSRERDQNQRSSSRERRVSRSPGRRSVEPSASNGSNNGGGIIRPAKMVSVPATVAHLEMDKSNNVTGGCSGNDSATATAVKRISVKRNVGEATAMAGSRVASSPRSQSPARINGHVKVSDEIQPPLQQQQPSLSRSSSRKTEQSPYRRNPLSEIDTNSQQHNRIQSAKDTNNGSNQKPKTESKSSHKVAVSQVNSSKTGTPATATRGVVNIITSTAPPLTNTEGVLARSRSGRQSREFDINPEVLLNQNQTPSYTKMLLQDIQNFHQKNSNSVSLPACVTKACSIVEAVADLNSSAFSEDRNRDPFDDIVEPSFHKYVTVRRGSPARGEDTEDQESSGSNSFVGIVQQQQQQQWGNSAASWEPNSADSTDSSCRSKTGVDRDESKRRTGERRRESDCSSSSRRSGIGRGRVGGSGSKVLHTVPVAATGTN